MELRATTATRPPTVAGLAAAVATALAWFAVAGSVAHYLLTPTPVVTVAALLVSAAVVVLLSRGPGLLHAIPVGVAGVVTVDWYLIPPTHDSVVPGPATAFALAAYLLAGGLLGWLAASVVGRAAAAEAARSALAREQAALRRVATLVARQAAAGDLLAAVTREARELLGTQMVTMVRYEQDGTATVVACEGEAGRTVPTGTVVTLEGESVAALVRDTSRPARLDDLSRAGGSVADLLRGLGIGTTVGCPVTVNDRLWGALVAAAPAGDLFPEETERHLAEFTSLVATAISNAQNHEELQASRARVVAAADATRRQLERDLHDGIQQRLVSLSLTLRQARLALDAAAPAPDPGLAHVQDEVAGVIEDLRELSHGIHPAILSAGGLRPALRTMARRSPVAVRVEVEDDLGLTEALEVGSYYVVNEALANVVKHARASLVDVEVTRGEGQLVVRVSDDGVGGASSQRGTGLVGLSDRVAALGGRLTVSSPQGGGTSVEARLPLPA